MNQDLVHQFLFWCLKEFNEENYSKIANDVYLHRMKPIQDTWLEFDDP